jgi:hypothetical protein
MTAWGARPIVTSVDILFDFKNKQHKGLSFVCCIQVENFKIKWHGNAEKKKDTKKQEIFRFGLWSHELTVNFTPQFLFIESNTLRSTSLNCNSSFLLNFRMWRSTQRLLSVTTWFVNKPGSTCHLYTTLIAKGHILLTAFRLVKYQNRHSRLCLT